MATILSNVKVLLVGKNDLTDSALRNRHITEISFTDLIVKKKDLDEAELVLYKEGKTLRIIRHKIINEPFGS